MARPIANIPSAPKIKSQIDETSSEALPFVFPDIEVN